MALIPELAYSESTKNESLPRLAEYDFDFETNNFKTKNGKHYLVYENEALKIWIKKTFITSRYKYGAYSVDYGSELDKVIGSAFNLEVKKAEITRYITECLIVNPYIKSIDDIEFIKQKSDSLLINIILTSIYGKENISWKQVL